MLTHTEIIPEQTVVLPIDSVARRVARTTQSRAWGHNAGNVIVLDQSARKRAAQKRSRSAYTGGPDFPTAA